MKRLIICVIAMTVAVMTWYWFSQRSSTAPRLPATVEEFRQVPGGAPTMDAGEYVISRLKEGALPGFSKDDHGSLVVPNMKPPEERTEAYPILRVICLRKNGDDSDYYYWVVREAKDAPWQLRKGWRANADGKVLQEYPLP